MFACSFLFPPHTQPSAEKNGRNVWETKTILMLCVSWCTRKCDSIPLFNLSQSETESKEEEQQEKKNAFSVCLILRFWISLFDIVTSLEYFPTTFIPFLQKKNFFFSRSSKERKNKWKVDWKTYNNSFSLPVRRRETTTQKKTICYSFQFMIIIQVSLFLPLSSNHVKLVIRDGN